jgi:hypothetical protein
MNWRIVNFLEEEAVSPKTWWAISMENKGNSPAGIFTSRAVEILRLDI